MSNTELWDSVEKTDPKFTKKVNQRGGFTAIGAQYQVRRATEMFGPYGIGWGVKEESFERYKDTGLVLYQATLWYKHDKYPSAGAVPIHSSIKYHSNNRVDDDFAKKVATDALTKGLSRLGFNADVFMGLFDDNKYVSSLKKEFGSNGAAENTEESWREKVVTAINTLDDDNKLIVTKALEDGKINATNWKRTIDRIIEIRDAVSDE